MKRENLLTSLLCLALTFMVALAWGAEEPTQTKESVGSSEELSKELSNPVSSLWSISFQQNNYWLDMGPGRDGEWNSNLNFQPVLPVALTSEWNLITRPVVTLFNSVRYTDPETRTMKRTTGFGDTVLMEMLSPSPKLAANWLLGLGPTFIFPTASSDYTGQGKYQVGPAAVAGYLSQKWILGVFVQNWTSFAGDDDRKDVSQMNLQPIASYFLPGGWNIGYSGNILANWRENGSNAWTVPLGLQVGKVVKLGALPVRIALAGQYMVEHPSPGGQEWNVQLTLTPVLPKLIKGNLFGD